MPLLVLECLALAFALFGDGWLIRIRMTSADEQSQLLDLAGYKKVLDEA